MDENGMFQQAEMTSCGLNGKPLKGIGTYPARIACNLWSKDGTGRYDCKNPKKAFADHPYFTQDKKDGDEDARQYIANMRDGAVAGFKYFEMGETTEISLCIRGSGTGHMRISYYPDFKEVCGTIPVMPREKWHWEYTDLACENGIRPVYIQFTGAGSVDFSAFNLFILKQ